MIIPKNSVKIGSIFPIPGLRPNNCSIYIPGWSWDTSFMRSLGLAWFPLTVTFANLQICHREVTFGVLYLFDIKIDLDVMGGFAVMIFLIKLFLKIGR